MKHFNYLLQELLNEKCEILYELNQYALKRFFEYCFSNQEYINKVRHGNTSLQLSNKKRHNQKHEGVLMVACITSLTYNSDDFSIFQVLYTVYLDYKMSTWKGRSEWNDFHKTLFSHFIWNNNNDKLNWTWSKMCDYISKIDVEKKSKHKNTVSEWRKSWYKEHIRKLKNYMTKMCFLSENTEMIEFFVENNILNPKLICFKKLLNEHGFEYDQNRITETEFSKDKEWEWMNCSYNDICDLDTIKVIKLCNEIPRFKHKLNDYFKSLLPSKFWIEILNLNETYISSISKLDFKSILRSDFKQDIIDNIKGHEPLLINLIFKNYKFLSDDFIFFMKECLEDFKINIDEGIELLCLVMKKEKTDDFEYLRKPCQFWMNQTDKGPHSKINVFINEAYWIYSLLGITTDIIGAFENKEVICPICISSLHIKKTKQLICGHIFHRDCLHSDMKKRGTQNVYNCPMCRSKIHPELLQDLKEDLKELKTDF